MKAWIVRDKLGDCCTEIIYAETRGKAISYALSHCESFDYYDYIDLYARRFKEFDQYYNGDQNPLFWYDDDMRIKLVRDYGWSCFDGCYEGERCPAYKYCSDGYEMEEENNAEI